MSTRTSSKVLSNFFQFSITPRTESQPIIHLSTKNIKSKVQTRCNFRVRPKPISRLLPTWLNIFQTPACGSRVPHDTCASYIPQSLAPVVDDGTVHVSTRKMDWFSHPSVFHGLWCFWPFWTGRGFWQNDDPHTSRSSLQKFSVF